MRKIINGKAYDTDKASFVGTWDNGMRDSDLNLVEQTLYRKRTGEYFLHSYGGPNTQYAVSTGANSWSGSSKIDPLTYDEARTWAEEHLNASEYENEFGPVNDNEDGTVALTVRVNAAAKAKLQREASRTGRSQSEILEALLESLN